MIVDIIIIISRHTAADHPPHQWWQFDKVKSLSSGGVHMLLYNTHTLLLIVSVRRGQQQTADYCEKGKGSTLHLISRLTNH